MKIAAIGPSAQVLAQYPHAEIVDGRGKAILPGLINCHAHLTATLERGFNEDFGFPNAAHPALSPTRLLQGDEKTLMASHAIYRDETRLIQTTRDAADELEGLFEADHAGS